MKSIAGANEFSEYLTEEFVWRLKEITDLKQLAINSGSYGVSARKGGLALAYAHWEGYARFTVESYIGFVSQRKIQYKKLQPNFQIVVMDGMLSKNDNLKNRIELITAIRASNYIQFKKFSKNLISTGGNLNSDKLRSLCDMMDCSIQDVVPDCDFLDKQIVGKRNQMRTGLLLRLPKKS